MEVAIKTSAHLPGFTVTAIASISLNVMFADLTASSTTASMFSRCKSCANVGIMPPLLKRDW